VTGDTGDMTAVVMTVCRDNLAGARESDRFRSVISDTSIGDIERSSTELAVVLIDD
jgi:hypothetical protein